MTTARDLITSAFSDINESEAEAAIEAVDAELALTELNRMMASLRPNVGWVKATSLDSTATINDDAELYVQKSLAKHLAGHYEVPVSNALNESWRMARKDVMSRYVRIEPSSLGGLPCPAGSYQYAYAGDGDINGQAYSRTSKTVTSDYTILLSDDVIYVDCSNGPVTLTLPAIATADGYGFEIEKVDRSANMVILDADGTETIAGDLDYRFNEYQRKVELSGNNGEWQF